MIRHADRAGACVSRFRIAVATSVLVLWLPAVAVKAQPYYTPEYKACVDRLLSADAVIAACTVLLRQDSAVDVLNVAFLYRDQARARQNDMKGALADYDEAVRLSPDDATSAHPMTLRGGARLALGDVAGARADLDAAIRIRPNSMEAWAGRALVRRKAGDLKGALSDTDEAVRQSESGSPSAQGFMRAQRARILRAQGDRAQGDLTAALADLTEATRFLPRFLAIRAEYCLVRLLAGPLGEAHTVCEVTETLARSSDGLALAEGTQLAHLLADRPDAAVALARALTAEANAPWVHRLRIRLAETQAQTIPRSGGTP